MVLNQANVSQLSYVQQSLLTGIGVFICERTHLDSILLPPPNSSRPMGVPDHFSCLQSPPAKSARQILQSLLDVTGLSQSSTSNFPDSQPVFPGGQPDFPDGHHKVKRISYIIRRSASTLCLLHPRVRFISSIPPSSFRGPNAVTGLQWEAPQQR